MPARLCTLLLIGAFLLTAPEAWAQRTVYDRLEKPILEELERLFGEPHKVLHIVEVDSVQGIRSNNYATPLPVLDPYDTLQGTAIFTARVLNGFATFLGVYRYGTVVWTAPQRFEHCDPYMLVIKGTRDLNRDGTVDVMVGCPYNLRSEGQGGELWIYSWDGQQAEAINATEGEAPRSILQSIFEPSFGYVDVNGDGVFEIEALQTLNPDTHQYWSWNGTAYGSWPDTPTPTETGFTPADLAEADVEFSVEQTGNRLRYAYRITSRPSSLRPIEEVRLEHVLRDTIGTAPAGGWTFYGHSSEYLHGWVFLGEMLEGGIEPGETLEGFSVTSRALPAIGRFYVRTDSRSFGNPSHEALMEDRRTNSYRGWTVVPGLDPALFDPGQFLDTLRTYPQRALDLGWITDSTLAQDLTAGLDQARAHLATADSSAARTTLLEVIDTVEAEQDALTAEAYALLYYNADYLAARLPE
jgi:hypothetical protein